MFGDKPKQLPQHFALILVPEFTMMPVTSAIIGAGLLMALQRLTGVVLALFSGPLTDRLGAQRLLLPCSLGMAAGFAIIAAGHVVLGLPATVAFYLGLLIVAAGSGLLKSNMSTLVSQLYPEGGARRDAGFSLFYMGINIGAFAGQILCPWLAQRFGWRWGFSAAAAGMFLGLVQFQMTKQRIAHIGEWHEHPGQNVRRDRFVLIAGIGSLVLLTGIHLMRTGRIEANLGVLNEEARLPRVAELIARKQATEEQATLDGDEFDFHASEYRRLVALLEEASKQSSLPDEPTAHDALDDLLVRLRLTRS